MGNFLQEKWERIRDHINKKKDEPAQQQNENIYHQKACDKIMEFYRSHQSEFEQYFSDMRSPSERKAFIKDVYGMLNYTNATSIPQQNNNGAFLYRGLSAKNAKDIQDYTKGFVDGEVVFGQKAQLHGTGLYMTTNESVAMKYAAYGGQYGSILRCETVDGMKIADSVQLTEDKEAILQLMSSQNQDDRNVLMFANFLDDNGVFAAVVGYDAIHVQEKEYMLVLNRSSIAVDGITYYRDGQECNLEDLEHDCQEIESEITDITR